MASPESPPSPTPFSMFPEDVQLTILSFLRPTDIATFACTSRRFATLCRLSRLWYTICDRRWGSKTVIGRWGGGGVPFALLYKALDRWENLIGFWRWSGQGDISSPSVVFFEWGPSFITGSVVSPSPEAGSYSVLKIPFLWMGFSPRGEPVSLLHPVWPFDSTEGSGPSASISGLSDSDFVPVTVGFMGENHFFVEENQSYYVDIRDGGRDFGSSKDLTSPEESSPADALLSEIYQYFANRTRAVRDTSFREQRWKSERDLHRRRRRWEVEHFVKITDCYPTPARPLQGLWKGICESMRLAFYLVTYDSMGGIACRRIGDDSEPFSRYSPVFWTSNTTFLEYPFSDEEEALYNSREHTGPVTTYYVDRERAVSRILYINSSYNLIVPNSFGSFVSPQNFEGRIWMYDTGTFGFGFLRNNYTVDLKHIAMDGYLLDTVEFLYYL